MIVSWSWYDWTRLWLLEGADGVLMNTAIAEAVKRTNGGNRDAVTPVAKPSGGRMQKHSRTAPPSIRSGTIEDSRPMGRTVSFAA
jgi:hypothetical protein